MSESEIECEVCLWHGLEDDLIIVSEYGHEIESEACPDCKSPYYLVDKN